MSSLKLPKDLDILRFCQIPRIRYEIMKEFSNGQATTEAYMTRLERMGLLFVVEQDEYRPGKKRKRYLITAKGRAVLRGYEEAERRV